MIWKKLKIGHAYSNIRAVLSAVGNRIVTSATRVQLSYSPPFKIAGNKYTLNFRPSDRRTDLYEAYLSGPHDSKYYIPLLFEKSKIVMITGILKKLRLPKDTPFEYFKQVVSGCIMVCMKKSK